MTKAALYLGWILLMSAFRAAAYEISTHEVLTKQAAQRSLLNSQIGASLLTDLGLGDWSAKNYSASVPGKPLFDIQDILGFGANFEDGDTAAHMKRPLNHFFDPQYNNFAGRGLDFGPLAQGLKSVDWALEDTGDAVAPAGDVQTFSFRDAQKYLFESLTDAVPADRRTKASLMFQSLGQVIHHIEDMAQPQHVRNDQHVHGVPFNDGTILNETEWSFYERYTRDSIESLIPGILDANPYPAPTFATAREFWHTPGATTPRFVGMAEFTAQNYVSFGTQYLYQGTDAADTKQLFTSAPGFPLPNEFNHDGTGKHIDRRYVTVTLTNGTTKTGWTDFVVGKVYDELHPELFNTEVRLSSPSIMNQPTGGRKLSHLGRFVENSETYADGYKILFPRAVAFATGLINHFFRGRIDFRKNPNAANGWYIDNLGTQAMLGQLSIYAEDGDGMRQLISVVNNVSIAAGQKSFPITFTEPPLSTTKLVAAFKGKIGAEGDLASGFFATAGKVISYEAPEIVVVGCSWSTNPGSPFYVAPRAFRWSSKTGLHSYSFSFGDRACAGGVSADGKVVVGYTQGQASAQCATCSNPFQSGQGGSQQLNVATKWVNDGPPFFLNGGANSYSSAWKANADGSEIYGEGYAPSKGGVRSLTWLKNGTVRTSNTVGDFPPNTGTSADGTVTLTLVGGSIGLRAAFIRNGVTTEIPLPAGDSRSAWGDVTVIPARTVSVKAPVLPPNAVVTQPAAGTTVAGTIQLVADASAQEGVESVQFAIDGQALQTPVADAPYAVSLDTLSIPNGPHSITVYVTSVSGKSATSAPITITVFNPPQLGSASLIAPSGLVTTTTPIFSWSAVQDASSYRLGVLDSVGGSAYLDFAASSIGCVGGSGTCSITLDSPLIRGRGYDWWVMASNSDVSGNWSNPASFLVSASNNANLSGLALFGASLSPAFASDVLSYSSTVPNAISTIMATIQRGDVNSSVAVNGIPLANASTSTSIALNVGNNMIAFVVTAQDGTTTKTYTINVLRSALSANADLAGLSVSTGSLTPAFNSGSMSYTVAVPNSEKSIIISPTVADSTASVSVNGAAVASGSASDPISLTVGSNLVSVVVTAQNGTNIKTYTVDVQRAFFNIVPLMLLLDD